MSAINIIAAVADVEYCFDIYIFSEQYKGFDVFFNVSQEVIAKAHA